MSAARWLGAAIIVATAIASGLWVRACNRPDTPPAPLPTSRASDAPAPATHPAQVAATPESASSLVDAARVEAAAGRYIQALAIYQRAHELDPLPTTLLEIGRMQHLTSRCREALRTTQGVLASSPDPAVAADAQNLLERIGRCD